jgi:hypothetical protein
MFILQRLRRWSVTKLVLVCIGWLAVCILAPVASIAVMFLFLTMSDGGSGGIGAVSSGFPILPFVFGPIVVLVALWIVARRTTAVPPTPTRSGPSELTGGENR